MKNSKIPSLYLIPTLIISIIIFALVLGALFVGVSYCNIAKSQTSKAKKPYEDYGIDLPKDLNCVFRYESPSDGFHGDGCVAVKYKTNGDIKFFSDFNSSADLEAEAELDFVLTNAKVPDDLCPKYSESYYWKSFSADDWGKKLIVFWFPKQETAYFGEAIT